MLIHVIKVSVRGRTRKSGGIVINTDFISDLVVSGTGAQFLYHRLPENRRGPGDLYVVEETVAEIRGKMDTALAADSLVVEVFPRWDITEDTVTTIFRAAEIVEIYPASDVDRDYSWMIVNEKGKNVKYLVDQYYIDFVGIAKTGSTSTTTSTTSSTSTSSTSTTTARPQV